MLAIDISCSFHAVTLSVLRMDSQRKMNERFLAAQAVQKRVRGMLARKHFGKKYIGDNAAASKLTIWFQTYFKYDDSSWLLCVV